jgi:phospholipase C
MLRWYVMPSVFVPVIVAGAVACSSGSSKPVAANPEVDAGVDAAGPPKDADTEAGPACAGPCPMTKILHLVVIVQENQTFDSHFGGYCTAASGSNPSCNDGPGCCEAMPATDPAGTKPTVLTDAVQGTRDPDHKVTCETAEINGGKMDKFATEPTCGSPANIVAGDPTILKPYWDLAAQGALADRYFQPVVGQSSANNMYFARAQWVFDDNSVTSQGAVGLACQAESGQPKQYTDTTIGDLLTTANVPWAFFHEGYAAMAAAGGKCPATPSDCPSHSPNYPCAFDPTDVPFEYYKSTVDNPANMKDLADFTTALDSGGLPAVSFVKGLGYKSEHPGFANKLSAGVSFATGVINHIEQSRYASSTLVVLVYDEGGGYFDHVAPPAPSSADGKPYGTRVPLLVTGPFAKKNFVSHTTMEHSSIVKFIEWNWLGGTTGQLHGRDAVVASLGSVINTASAGGNVPEQ